MTQAERIFVLLRRRGMTTGELLETRISVCPWKRMSEGRHYLKPGERIQKRTNSRGLIVYRVVKTQA